MKDFFIRSWLGGRISCGDNWDTETRIGGAIRDIVADRSVVQLPESNFGGVLPDSF
ncbi:hypothetical protein SH449x_002061 [Pirellulaceae bacterium SH449]